MAAKVISLEITLPNGKVVLNTLQSLNEALIDTRSAIAALGDSKEGLEPLKQTLNFLIGLTSQFKRENVDATDTIKKSYNTIKQELKNLIEQYQTLVKEDRDSDVGANLLKNISKLRQELTKIDGELKGTLQKQQFPIGSYRAMSAELVKLRNEYKNLSEDVRNSPVGTQIASQANVLATRLQDLDKKLGLYQRNVGNYRSAIGSVADILTFGIATGGITAAVGLLDTAIKTALNNTINFSRQLSTIRAVTQATPEEFTILKDEILKVGASSEFTSQEIGALAIAYGKLGLTATEITSLLAVSTDIATTSGEDLAKVAETIGGVLNIFQLKAEDAALAGDILAKAFNSGALDVQSFGTAIGIVGPAASAVGVDLKTTAGLLSILKDESIDASTAGTSLRNIFIETANSGRSLQEAFDLINNAENKLAVANALFGKDASVVAIALAKQEDKLVDLIAELDNAEGSSKATAEAMRKDLKGAFDELTGATETLGIAIFSTQSGPIAAFVKGIADIVQFFARLVQGEEEAVAKFNEVKAIVGALIPIIAAFTVAIVFNSKATAYNAGVAIGKWIANISKLTGITRLITAVQWAWNAAITANPIGIAIVAVGALVSAIYYAYTSTSEFAKLLRKVFEFAADLGKKLLAIFNPVAYVANFVLGEKLMEQFNKKTQQNITKDNATEIAKRNIQNDQYLEKNKKQLDGLGIFSAGVGKTINKNLKLDNKALEKSAEEARKSLEKKLAPKDVLSFDKFDLDNLRRRASFQYGTKGDKDAASELEKLTKRQTELKNAIQESIVKGKPYADLLAEYYDITFKINAAEKEWQDTLDSLDLAVRGAAGSVEFYQQKVSSLKKELESAKPEAINKIVGNLDKAEKDLKLAEDAIKRLQRAASNSSFTALLETDVQPLIDSIKTAKDLADQNAEDTITNERVLAETKKAIAITAEIQTLEARKQLYKEGSKEFLDIDKQLQSERAKLGGISSAITEAEAIAKIQIDTDRKVLQTKSKSYEEYQKNVERLELEGEIKILETQLSNTKLSLEQRLILQRQYYDKLQQLGQLEADNDVFALDAKTQNILTFVDLTLSQISGLGDSLNELINVQFDERIKSLEKYYDKEIEAARGNKEVVERLEKEKASKIDALKREQFEKNKKIELAQAAISYAQGIINILTAASVIKQPFDAIYKGIQLAFLTGQYALQTSAIRARSYAVGGYTTATGQRDHTGFRVAGVVHEDEYVIPKHVLDTPAGASLAAQAESLRTKKGSPNYAAYAVGGFVLPASQNDSIGSARTTVYKLTLEDSQIDRFATIVADEVSSSVSDAIVEGYREAALEAARRKNLQTITG
jgi:hypothetical protein